MSEKALKVGIVAGEASGDILAAGLIKQLKKQYPNATFEGIAGPKMQAQGCQSLFDMEELSVMGLVEVLSRIRRLMFVRKTLLNHFLTNPPDVFIGVDAPDFNLGLELKLKNQGIITVQYVSPTVWAWREKRIFKIAKATNLVLSIFPFEKQVYDKHHIPCEYVGHTMADDIAIKPDIQKARLSLKLKENSTVLALLPGSRKREVDTLLDVFIQSCLLLKTDIADLNVLIPVVNRQRKDQVDQYIQTHNPDLSIQVVIGHAREVMIASDAVLLASGTATLEAMLCKKNMVTAYKLSGITYQMMKWLYKAKYFALPNVLADEKLIPELLQNDVTPQRISELLLPMLTLQGGDEQQVLITKFEALHESLKKDADVQSAAAVANLIEQQP
ncbi:lipid-A-disaccharide synthase [Paraglaciecola psychrophila]|uniref:Lipid-A-disaccharide synthase n=1 Tax=Paraglaciecola psychrophila 170 TaxID=1129794 RepID=K7AF59_9ALTE|nr:lipid-A-disaccharide synthase [Paraglaciecola psychrophila]AGH46195.1 lipid-A-disaccharide synthase [Paraglaciecola psychrophila 170]GAC39278.1 lipid-A-disaccharide synthase [Paraglaciecola psychrophila 170]